MQKMMDALVKPERAKGLILTQVPVPEPGIGEVLIKIHKTAICGTDVHIYNWDPWSQQHINPPMVIGHEYVGEIAALGPGVTEYKVGQIVSGEGHIVCGHCRNCRAGNGQWCKETKGVGVDRQGAFAEYVCIPKTNVILMPDDIPEDIISFFDAYGNATHTATMFDVVGEDVLITGAGPIGMMAVGICRQNGARNIIVTDVNDYRLNIAKQMGATTISCLKSGWLVLLNSFSRAGVATSNKVSHMESEPVTSRAHSIALPNIHASDSITPQKAAFSIS